MTDQHRDPATMRATHEMAAALRNYRVGSRRYSRTVQSQRPSLWPVWLLIGVIWTALAIATCPY